MNIILESLIFALPMYIANSSATLSTSFPIIRSWTTPIDLGRKISGKRILGKGKTFRGLFLGTFIGTIGGFYMYKALFSITNSSVLFSELEDLRVFQLCFLLSFGALVGDIVKSFIKRRLGIASGKPWFPFDQIDFVLGGILYGSIIYFPGWKVILILLLISPILHFISNVLAYTLKLKDVWW